MTLLPCILIISLAPHFMKNNHNVVILSSLSSLITWLTSLFACHHNKTNSCSGKTLVWKTVIMCQELRIKYFALRPNMLLTFLLIIPLQWKMKGPWHEMHIYTFILKMSLKGLGTHLIDNSNTYEITGHQQSSDRPYFKNTYAIWI